MENNTHSIHIKNSTIWLNDKMIYQSSPQIFSDFIKEVYKHFELDYSKFYKMDALCKLGIIAGSLLLNTIPEPVPEDTALILSNRSSCIDIDKKHQDSISISGGYARPADFVYTLPNIILGEISIKYKLKSENSFFIFDSFNPTFLTEYVNGLFDSNRTKSALYGWLEVNDEDYHAFLCYTKVETNNRIVKEELVNLYEIK